MSFLYRIRLCYYYFYYFLYRISESAPSKWWSEWKATFFLVIFELFIFAFIVIYLQTTFNLTLLPEKGTYIAFFATLFLTGVNYLIFLHREKWKLIIDLFSEWPSRKKLIWSIYSSLIILLIFSILIFTIYLMSVAN